MTSQRLPELPDLTVIEPVFEGPGSQTMAPVQHLPVPPEDPAGMDSIHGPAPRRQQKPVTPSPPPQPPASTLPLRRVRALGIPDLLAAKQIAEYFASSCTAVSTVQGTERPVLPGWLLVAAVQSRWPDRRFGPLTEW
jgi:hypothetical protein